MAWVAPPTRVTGTLITASIWNQDIVANTLALKDPPTDSYNVNEGADYTTSSTSFVDVDGTDLLLTIVTTGGDIWVTFHGTVKGDSTVATSVTVYFDVTLDGTRQGTDDGLMFVRGRDATGDNHTHPVAFARLLTGVAAGSHDIKLQWKVIAGTGTPTATLYAGAGTSGADIHPQFVAREMS